MHVESGLSVVYDFCVTAFTLAGKRGGDLPPVKCDVTTHDPVELVQGEGAVKRLLHTVPLQQRETLTAGYTVPHQPDKLGYDTELAA